MGNKNAINLNRKNTDESGTQHFNKSFINSKSFDNPSFSETLSYNPFSYSDKKSLKSTHRSTMCIKENRNIRESQDKYFEQDFSDPSGNDSLSFKKTNLPSMSDIGVLEDLEKNFHDNDIFSHCDFNFMDSKQESENIRNKFYCQLIRMNLLNSKIKLSHNILIASWDDSLFCTSYLNPKGMINDRMKINRLSNSDRSNFEKLEYSLMRLLTVFYSNNFDIYLVSDAKNGWIEDSISRFLPGLKKALDNFKDLDRIRLLYTQEYKTPSYSDNINGSFISSISSINEETKHSNREEMIKEVLKDYNNLTKYYEIDPIYNIICLSDYLPLLESISKGVKEELINDRLEHFPDHERGIFIKTLKLKETPSVEEVIKQNNLIADQFKVINNSVRSLNIKISKR